MLKKYHQEQELNYCTVEFKLYNSNNEVLYANTITKQDLLKDRSYNYKFSCGFFIFFFGSKYSVNVTGKCSSV